ncbi:MAG: hypothetical protein QXE01_06255 [Sulfolobales archaeon]
MIERMEELSKTSLPRRVIEESLIPEEGILHIRFREPEEGEPIHLLIHLYRDKRAGEITAVEVNRS